jgi:hypothetical protein
MLIFLYWYAYLYLGHTPTLIHIKRIRDELESNMIYDQSYPCNVSLVISCLRLNHLSYTFSFPVKTENLLVLFTAVVTVYLNCYNYNLLFENIDIHTCVVESDVLIAKVFLIFLFAPLELNYKWVILPIEDFIDPLYLWVSVINHSIWRWRWKKAREGRRLISS